ncbi:MAG TPA: hypothetical protein VEG34_02635, partial [Thermoanaerobaculia bacterium]|nr:hypothetical protein [Thermoanaerobaculia bacterium]
MTRCTLVHLIRGSLMAALLVLANGSEAGAQRGDQRGQGREGRLPLSSLRLPPGFTISVFSADVPGARSLALSPGGILYVG